jgi:predicted nucleic acid-binding protein
MLAPEDVAVSPMNGAELWYGALNSQHPDKDTKDVEAFLEPIVALSFDAEAAREFGSVPGLEAADWIQPPANPKPRAKK